MKLFLSLAEAFPWQIYYSYNSHAYTVKHQTVSLKILWYQDFYWYDVIYCSIFIYTYNRNMLFVVGHFKPEPQCLLFFMGFQSNWTHFHFPFSLVCFNNVELAIIMQASSSTLLYVSTCCILLILNISHKCTTHITSKSGLYPLTLSYTYWQIRTSIVGISLNLSFLW